MRTKRNQTQALPAEAEAEAVTRAAAAEPEELPPEAPVPEAEAGAVPEAEAERPPAEPGAGEFGDALEQELQRRLEPLVRRKEDMERLVRSWMPVMDAVTERYGSRMDPGEMARKLREDRGFWDEEGRKEGVDPAVLRYLRQMERENRMLRDRDRRMERERQERARMDGWAREAERLRDRYPDLDFRKETEDRGFMALLASGVPLELAYRARHLEDLIGQAEQRASRETEERVADAVRTRGSRPSPAGAGSTGAFTVRDDVARLSREQRADMARRAMQGETISF